MRQPAAGYALRVAPSVTARGRKADDSAPARFHHETALPAKGEPPAGDRAGSCAQTAAAGGSQRGEAETLIGIHAALMWQDDVGGPLKSSCDGSLIDHRGYLPSRGGREGHGELAVTSPARRHRVSIHTSSAGGGTARRMISRIGLVDQRSHQVAAALAPRDMDAERYAADVEALAGALGLSDTWLLGNSSARFVSAAARDRLPGPPRRNDVSAGRPTARCGGRWRTSSRTFEPADMGAQVRRPWGARRSRHQGRRSASLVFDQLPFHFADPRSPRIEERPNRDGGAVYDPDVLRSALPPGPPAGSTWRTARRRVHPCMVISRAATIAAPRTGAREAIAPAYRRRARSSSRTGRHMAFIEQQGEYLEAVGAS